MKFPFSIIFILLFSLYFCEESTNKTLEEEEVNIGKELNQKITEYLKEMGFENLKIITKEQVRDVFVNIYEMSQFAIKLDNETKQNTINMIEFLSEQLFNLLATKEKNVIEVDQIMEYFSPKSIEKYLNYILKLLGLDVLIDSIAKPFLLILEKMFQNISKSSDL